jgi:GNAT superfamily N-acetyltransferase
MIDSIPYGYEIRYACAGDLKFLEEVELAAARMFQTNLIPEDVRNQALPLEILESAREEGRLFIAVDKEEEPAGFIVVRRDDDEAYIVELDVHPDHQRKALGRALIGKAVEWSISQKCSALTLTTFLSVPWNAPYYERLGFKRLEDDEISDALIKQLAHEKKRGLDDRVAMRKCFND